MDNASQPYPEGQRRDSEHATTECWFCPGVQSVALAPRHSGGDTDRPAHWVPICEKHRADWYDELPEDERLPIIPRDGVMLSTEHASTLQALLSYRFDNDVMEPEDIEAYDALTSTLMHAPPANDA